MNVVRVDEMNALLGLLQEIRDRLPERHAVDTADYFVSPVYAPGGVVKARVLTDVPIRKDVPVRPAQKPPAGGSDAAVQMGKRQGLAKLLVVLDDWITGARENHVAGNHRNELHGEECWRQFTPQDFRRMVNDAAREMGVGQFELLDQPREDQF